MANPYSKYTGSRISPVPANYLQSTAAMSENLRKGLTSIGEAIGGYLVAKDKKEQDILNQEAVEDWYDSEPTPYGYEYNEEGLLTRIEGAKELTPKEAYADLINTTKGRMSEWLELYGGDKGKRKVSPEVTEKVMKNYQSIISKAEDKYSSGGKEVSALGEKVLGIDKIAEAMGWDAKETATAKARVYGALEPDSNVPASLQSLKAIQGMDWYKKATPEQQAEFQQMLMGIFREPADNSEYNRDVTAGTAYIDALKAQGNVPEKIIEKMSEAKTLTAMKAIFQNMPDDSVLPSEVQTWNAIEESLKGQGVDEKEINEYEKIHYGLKERDDEVQSLKNFKAYEAILDNPNLTDEQKSRAGVLFGYVTKEEQLLGAYEKWENGEGKDATDVEKQRKARALGIIGPLDTKETLLDIKLKANQAKNDKKLAEAVSKGEVEILDIPGSPNHKFVRASADQGWQMINTGTGSVVRDVTAEEAREWNKKLKDAGFPHQWHEAPSKSGKTTYELINPTGDPFNAYMRGALFGTGGGGTGGVVPVPKSQLSAEEQAMAPGTEYILEGVEYRITPNGGRVRK